MSEYKKSYFSLFCAVTDTIENLESILMELDTQNLHYTALQNEIKKLKSAQQNSEELFISN